jgi:hypothetical protein
MIFFSISMLVSSTNNQARLGNLEHVNLAMCKTQNPNKKLEVKRTIFLFFLFMRSSVAISGWKEELQVV